ncbi:MAG: hypothetical protein AAB967_02115, partial [Patescibacteria group bacterium]
FVPLKNGVTGLLLWNKNQELFLTAGERLSGITRVAEARGLGEREDILLLLEEARENLRSVQAANDELKARFSARDIPADIFLRIKFSLVPLASVYEVFSS